MIILLFLQFWNCLMCCWYLCDYFWVIKINRILFWMFKFGCSPYRFTLLRVIFYLFLLLLLFLFFFFFPLLSLLEDESEISPFYLPFFNIFLNYSIFCLTSRTFSKFYILSWLVIPSILGPPALLMGSPLFLFNASESFWIYSSYYRFWWPVSS